jgi:NADH:ubiquinone oxidoreductase subunit C
VRLLGERLGDVVSNVWTDEDTVEVQVAGERLVDTLRTLRDDEDFGFFYLFDLAGVDYGPGKWFEVVYHLYSARHPAWLRIRTRADRADPHVPTVTGLWEGAMFHEREMYDMFGIISDGNPDLRRIYMSPDYRSFPLRRDFILPDDAADSAAAGVLPLERPETWNLESLTETGRPPGAVTTRAAEEPGVEAGETMASESRPR